MKEFDNAQLESAIREDMRGELEAINQYDLHYRSTDNPAARAIWKSIRDEEKVHFAELLTLLTYISPKECKFLNEGEREAKEIIKQTTQGEYD
ncbi:MAG: ubiquinone biosynthesis protein COQ7 [Clostridia bacterium]